MAYHGTIRGLPLNTPLLPRLMFKRNDGRPGFQMPDDAPKDVKKGMKKALTKVENNLTAYTASEVDYTPEVHTMVLWAYYEHGLDLAAVSRVLKIPFRQLVRWKQDTPQLAADLKMVEEIRHEEVHGQFIQRVLDPMERNPAWKIFYLKAHDPRYAEKARKREVDIRVVDSAFDKSPKQIAGQETAREALAAGTE